MSASPVTIEKSLLLNVRAERLWSLAADTDRVNRLVKLPPVLYRFESLPGGGVRTWARASLMGLPVEWEEKPFEWQCPGVGDSAGRFEVERIFRGGPMDRLRMGIRIARENDGARATVFVNFVPRRSFLTPFVRLMAGREIAKMVSLLGRFEQEIRSGVSLPAPELRMSSADAVALARGKARVAEKIPPESLPILERLIADLTDSPDRDLVGIRPFAWALESGFSALPSLEVFLHATSEGLLDMEWALLCPHCKGRPSGVAHLADLPEEGECAVCAERFLVEFDRSVEVRFTVAPGIRRVSSGIFCRGGPMNTPFIFAQYRVAPAASVTLPASLLARKDHSHASVPHACAPHACVRARPATGLARETQADGGVRFENLSDREIVLSVEDSTWEDHAATAALVAILPTFQRLFASDVLAAGQEIAVRRLVVLFSDLTGSTALYQKVGDARAYSLVRDHFRIFDEVLARHNGIFVKTIGDAVMAVFARAGDAIAAAHEAQGRMKAPMLLKLGLHAGPLFAVRANDRNDYFGSTVNIAARLVGLAETGETVISRDVADEVGAVGRGETANLKGFETPFEIFRVKSS